MGCFVQSHFSQRAFEIKVAKPNTYSQEQKMGMECTARVMLLRARCHDGNLAGVFEDGRYIHEGFNGKRGLRVVFSRTGSKTPIDFFE